MTRFPVSADVSFGAGPARNAAAPDPIGAPRYG